MCPIRTPCKGDETVSPTVGHMLAKEGRMKEDLKRIIDQLDEEDIYLLYITALEMRRR